MSVKYCEYCRRYVLDVFMPYHNKQHKYMCNSPEKNMIIYNKDE